MALTYYIYLYGDPDTGKIFYVGKGRDNRHKIHLTYARNDIAYNRNPYLTNKIKKICRKGKSPLIHKIGRTNNEELAYKTEKKIIEKIGLKNLCNLAEGGLGSRITDKQKQKISEALKIYYSENDNPFKGRKHTKESLELLRQASTGKTASLKTKRKMSESAKRRGCNFPKDMVPNRLGKKHTEETKLKIALKKQGHKQSQETINRRKKTMVGIKDTPEYRDNLSKAVTEWWAKRKLEVAKC